MPESTAPTILEIIAKNGSADASIYSSILAEFGETIQRGSGNTTLRKNDGTFIEKFTPIVGGVSISDRTLTINPSVKFSYEGGYILDTAPMRFRVLPETVFAGLVTCSYIAAHPKPHILRLANERRTHLNSKLLTRKWLI
jgi:hypothetical protein